jgi:hypothetical protein
MFTRFASMLYYLLPTLRVMMVGVRSLPVLLGSACVGAVKLAASGMRLRRE